LAATRDAGAAIFLQAYQIPTRILQHAALMWPSMLLGLQRRYPGTT